MRKIISCIPNTITICNLLSGVMAIIAARSGSATFAAGLNGFYWAMIFIGASALFDFLDGASARLLNAHSPIGKELDSLSDLVSFGVAPALMVYSLMTEQGAPILAFAALFIPAMGALRLARFNIDDSQSTTFTGLPIPASAIFWIGATGWCLSHGYVGNGPLLMMIAVVSLLMVSNIRMFSLKFKSWNWRENFRRYVILIAAVMFVALEGVAGFMWSIILYILISLLGRKNI